MFIIMNQTTLLFAIIIALLVTTSLNQSDITHIDFLQQPTFTDGFFWNNFQGLNLYIDQIEQGWNTTNFQGYFLNSNQYVNWQNNFALNLKMPKGWFYNCTLAGTSSNGVSCLRQLQGNQTFFAELGQFVWNTCMQPFWVIGLNNQKLNLLNEDLLFNLYLFFIDIYYATYMIAFHIEIETQADRVFQNQMRDNPYTIQSYLQEAWQYEEILYGLPYKAPGISVTAGPEWLASIQSFFQKVWVGIFTMEAVIFQNEADCTIENLLKEQSTKGYIANRVRVNDTFSYGSFSGMYVSISSLKIVEGDGIDGVTNTFAAALWYIDFMMEVSLFGFYDSFYDSHIKAGNYQSVFGPGPSYQPSAIYYAMMFTAMATDGVPSLVIPAATAGTSSKIKSWGLETEDKFKVIILNKDQNTSLNGIVNIQVQSRQSSKMTCIYMKAPSLSSKANDIMLGGYQYRPNNSTPVGTFQSTQYAYDYSVMGYRVNIRYAQAVVCQIPNANLIIPSTDQCAFESDKTITLVLMALLLVIFL